MHKVPSQRITFIEKRLFCYSGIFIEEKFEFGPFWELNPRKEKKFEFGLYLGTKPAKSHIRYIAIKRLEWCNRPFFSFFPT